MRWTRPLLLVAILVILGGVGATFYARLKEQNAGPHAKPKALPAGTLSSAERWCYTETVESKPSVTVCAKDMQEVDKKFHLNGVELHIFHKGATQFDKVLSDKAEFDVSKGILYSDGDVEITMGVPADEEEDAEPSGRLMRINSSGVTFESKTGKATTDRATSFRFDRGDGSAVGADYDPQTHELKMKSQVHLVWKGQDGKAVPMQVDSGDLLYKEKESKVYLGQWSKLHRDTLDLNAGPAVVDMDKGVIREVDTEHAQGTDNRPGRKIDYAADKLTMLMDESGQIKNILAEQNGKLVSTSDTAQTTVTSDRIDLGFNTADGDSILDTALATGHSVAESKPVLKQGVEPADTRILRSDVIKTKMRPGGQEIDSVETASAGAMEFIPNRPGQPHRWMNGDRLWIQYGLKNQISSVRSINVATKTQKPQAKDAKTPPPPALTWSQNFTADFDPKTAQLSKLQQWDNFRYEEGDRKATSDRALLEQSANQIHLTGKARVWDPTGSTNGDVILLDQKSGDFSADGNVNSTRMPDKKKPEQSSGGMLSEDEPMHAKAKKMISTQQNTLVRYEGNAIAWQGSNRLEADVIEIDRENNILKAHGHVVSQLLDKNTDKPDKKDTAPGAAKPAKKTDAAPVFTIVKAPELIYNDDDKMALYQGGVVLDRPNMKVKSRDLRAFLRDDENDSSLDHAFADGKVEIVQTAPDRTRTGTSEHAEYYVDESKVILEKGQPQLVDSLKGSTRGAKLTWFSNDDRLLVDGAIGQPVQSKLRRK